MLDGNLVIHLLVEILKAVPKGQVQEFMISISLMLSQFIYQSRNCMKENLSQILDEVRDSL